MTVMALVRTTAGQHHYSKALPLPRVMTETTTHQQDNTDRTKIKVNKIGINSTTEARLLDRHMKQKRT